MKNIPVLLFSISCLVSWQSSMFKNLASHWAKGAAFQIVPGCRFLFCEAKGSRWRPGIQHFYKAIGYGTTGVFSHVLYTVPSALCNHIMGVSWPLNAWRIDEDGSSWALPSCCVKAQNQLRHGQNFAKILWFAQRAWVVLSSFLLKMGLADLPCYVQVTSTLGIE